MVNWAEGVLEEWVLYGDRLAIGCGHIDGLVGDNLRRRDAFLCPVLNVAFVNSGLR